jgi:hypothetical protein
MPDERPILIQGFVHVAERHPVDASPRGEVNGRGIRRVQADEAARRVRDALTTAFFGEAVTACEPRAPLGDLDRARQRA